MTWSFWPFWNSISLGHSRLTDRSKDKTKVKQLFDSLFYSQNGWDIHPLLIPSTISSSFPHFPPASRSLSHFLLWIEVQQCLLGTYYVIDVGKSSWPGPVPSFTPLEFTIYREATVPMWVRFLESFASICSLRLHSFTTVTAGTTTALPGTIVPVIRRPFIQPSEKHCSHRPNPVVGSSSCLSEYSKGVIGSFVKPSVGPDLQLQVTGVVISLPVDS